MSWLRDVPIKRKLSVVILSTCSAALLLACAALAAYQLYDFRRSMARDMSVLADVLARNTQAALAFQDESGARGVLQALGAEPYVSAAAVFTPDGRRFAGYARPGAQEPAAAPASEGARFDASRLYLARPIVLDERRLGTIYLEADLSGIYARLRLFAAVAALLILLASAVALSLSTRLQRPITQPILALAETARVVAERKDYSLRAVAGGTDEAGRLTETFNQMLAGIEERDKALRGEIAEREAAESRAQAQLARLELLNRITRSIGEREDLRSIFQVVLTNLEERLPVDFCAVALRDQGGTLAVTAVGAASAAAAGAMSLAEGTHLDAAINGLGRCLHQGKLVYEPDTLRVGLPFPERVARAGLHSLVLAPLLVESQVFGLMLAARRKPGAFSSGECEFLKQLGEHVALAMNQKQLYGALQQAYEDLRQTQQAVSQQERLRALGQMASGIAHDINNAISPVMVYTDLLLSKEPNLSERARGYLDTMQRAIGDVAATVARMREFYRKREQQLTLAPVPLNRMVRECVELSRARWNDIPLQRGVTVRMATELSPEEPEAMGVESEVREALINLIFNAVDAMPDGGTLTLRTGPAAPAPAPAGGPPRRRAFVEVADTGVGMDEDTRRRCLEPFFTTKGERGTGLGLAMVYGVMQRHGGDVEIESAPGKGTTLRLTFPAPTGTDAAAPAAGPAPEPPSRQRILLVDDDPLLLKSLRDALEADGHVITSANGGQEGIEAFRESCDKKEPFAVVITDLGMPYVDGRKVSAAIKQLSPATPVVMLTGWGQRLTIEGDIPPHVDCLLSKPPKTRDLREALAQCLRPKT